MEIKVAGLSEFLNEKERYRVLVLGVAGAGKTPWAAQWPRPLFLAVDKSCPPSLAITRTPYVECASDQDVIQALDWVLANQGRPNFEHDTLVLDTFSVLQNRIASNIMRRAGRRDLADVDGGWGQLKAATQAITDRLARVDRLHVVVLVHLKDKFDAKEYEPDLVGSAKWDLPKDFPFVGHLYMDWKDAEAKPGNEGLVEREPVRRINWRANPRFPILRSPGGILRVTTVDFQPGDFGQIAESLRGGLKALEPEPRATQVVGQVPEPTPRVQPAPANVPGGPVDPAVARTHPRPEGYDPGGHTVAQVNAHLDEHPEEVEAVLKAEREGKARRGILEGPHAAPAAAEQAPAPQGGQEAAPTAQEAQETVESTLGGQVVGHEEDPILAAIAKAGSEAEFREIWQANRSVWTEEHNVAVRERMALLGQGGK